MSAILAPDGTPARAERRLPRAQSLARLYEAANRSDFRGYIYIPSLNPAEQLDSLTLSAIRDRTEVLYANGGAPRMLIDRLSLDEAGVGIWPKWVTGQEDYDQAATDAYHFANHDPRIFSANGQDDAYSVQYGIRRCIARYGDAFGQLLRPNPGALHPQMLLIPGWQCDNFGDEKPGEGWQDGIRTNDLGRPLEYCFIVTGLDGKRTKKIVPADDVLHFHDPFMPGQRRGEPCLAPVAKKMFRREDIGKALANGTLLRERLGFAIETKEGAEDGPSLADLTGESDGEVETKTGDDGEVITLKKIFGEQADENIQIPRLPNGSKIVNVESDRPGTAVMEYNDSILRECAWARKYPAEYVFFAAGIGQGTVSRAVLIAAGQIIIASREMQMRPQFCIRHPVFWVWQMIKAGYFDRQRIKVPVNWWMNKLIMPELPTVDKGREGALEDNRVATLRSSIEGYHGRQGEDASDVEDENMNAIRRRMGKLAKLNEDTRAQREAAGIPPFTYEQTWARSINIQAPQTTAPAPPPE